MLTLNEEAANKIPSSESGYYNLSPCVTRIL